MIIEITQKQATDVWMVCMDDLAVDFNSLEGAQAFVDQLKARIDAPHVWPVRTGRTSFTRPFPGGQSAYTRGAKMSADLVD